MEKKSLSVNAGKTRIMWCKVSMRILGSIHMVFAGRELVTTHLMRRVFYIGGQGVNRSCRGIAGN